MGVAVVAGLLVPVVAGPERPASAAVGSEFQPGYIISDANFFDGDAMSVTAVQAFLESKVTACASGYTCLKDYTQTTTSRSADAQCSAYAGAADERASQIIARVALACNVSPKVLLVLLQKEQSLVTHTAPTESRYQKATGYACPDTAACDSKYYGFFNQVYSAAWQFRCYATGNCKASMKPIGQPIQIQYHPNTACGTQTVVIQNQATRGLYIYTPYVPNSAALSNLYGTGDGCSSYGNRNFWRLYSDWFGSPTGDGGPYGRITSTSTSQDAVKLHGWAVDPDTSNSIAVHVYIDDLWFGAFTADQNDPALASNYSYLFGPAHAFDFEITGVPPGSREVCLVGINQGAGGHALIDCRNVDIPFCGGADPCPAIDRLAGLDRYGTAVSVSKSTYPGAVETVYLSTGADFADALAAAPAAASAGGPLLLTPPSNLPVEVRAELQRLSPDRVVVVGGEIAVNDSVLDELRVFVPEVVRVAGADRFATAREVARYAFPSAVEAYMVTGTNFPDAVSAGSVAGYRNLPILLVHGSDLQLDEATATFIEESAMLRATIVGGPAAVSSGIEADLAELVTVQRVGGSDRFEVARALTATVFTDASSFYLASGLNFPDALAGAAAAAASGSPLHLVRPNCVPAGTIDTLRAFDPQHVLLLGGEAALWDAVESMEECLG